MIMETPLNERQRKSAVLKFIIVCVISLLLMVYQVFISIDAYHASSLKSTNPSTESKTSPGE